MKTVPDPVDLLDWEFKQGILTFNPTDVYLDQGSLTFRSAAFTGGPATLQYFGPPPSYYDQRNLELPAFLPFVLG